MSSKFDPSASDMSDTADICVSIDEYSSPDVVQYEIVPSFSYSYLVYNIVATAAFIYGNNLINVDYDTACKYWYLYGSIGGTIVVVHYMYYTFEWMKVNRKKDSWVTEVIELVASVLITIQIIILLIVPCWFLFTYLDNKSKLNSLKKCEQLVKALHITDANCNDIIDIIKFY